MLPGLPGFPFLRSPLPPFGKNGSTLRIEPASCTRKGPVSQDGLSLVRSDCPFPGHHSEVKAPDLPLRYHRFVFSTPVRPGTPPPIPVSPGLSKFYVPFPLRGSNSAIPTSPGDPLPFGLLSSPSGSKRSLRSRPGSPPSKTPDFPSLPACGFIVIPACGSMFRDRYFLSGSLLLRPKFSLLKP